MKSNQRICIGATCLLLSALSSWGVDGRVLQLEVVPSETPSPQITISWDTQMSGVTNTIYKRVLGETGPGSWGTALADVAYPTASYVDTSVVVGTVYEYKVVRPAYDWLLATAAYAVSGIKAPLVEDRGKLILVVDNTLAASLASELALLEEDLIGDGWSVIRHNSPRHGTGTPEALKAWILAKYNEDPTNTKTLFLFGHLPIVKSGYANADGHGYHPHSTDLFYGELNGTWTDTGTYNYGTVVTPNLSGDGMYDQSYLPDATMELQVGRVDLADMPAWSDSETELLRNYLRKDHEWRHGIVIDPRKGVIKTGQGTYTSMERGGIHSLFHTADVTEVSDWNPEAINNPYTWGAGFGDWNDANYPNYDFKMVFTINFGSHKQNWETSNNAMRAMLAMPDYGLTCAWGARPAWFFHHMGMGETIGYSAFWTQNNFSGDYTPAGEYDWMRGYVLVNLMGDPTLRMYAVSPSTNVSATATGVGEVTLAWDASASTVEGYHVYRAADMDGAFVRQSGSLLTTTNFVDATAPVGTNFYMVRAVRLERVPTGSYYNPSQGAFAESFVIEGFNADQDGDGMDDSWENDYFGGTNQTNGAATDDWDGDGVDNLSEFIADTIPSNTNSLLIMTGLTKESIGFRITWKGGVEATQYLDCTSSLVGTGTVWQTIQTNLPPVDPFIDVLDLTGSSTQGFYRVRAQR